MSVRAVHTWSWERGNCARSFSSLFSCECIFVEERSLLHLLPSFPFIVRFATSEIWEAHRPAPSALPRTQTQNPKEREGDRPEPIFAVSFPGKENLLVLSALIKPRLKSSLSFLFPPPAKGKKEEENSIDLLRQRTKKKRGL